MRCEELAALLEPLDWTPGRTGGIAGITCDSRKAGPGMVFCAVRGHAADGNHYIAAALEAGAAAVVTAMPCAGRPGFYRVADDYLAYARLMQAWYGYPDRELELTAVTGTNGKTTTVFALEQLAAEPCGMISTVAAGCRNVFTPAEHTTPEAGEFFAALRRFADAGCRQVFFEASSHALDQHRLGGLRVRTAIFTNLTGDHLDYHGSAEAYYQAKKRLFSEYLAPDGIALIHLDGGGWSARLAAEVPGCHTFGRSPSVRHRVEKLSVDLSGSRFRVDGAIYHTSLVGDYNIDNLAGVILAKRLNGETVPESLDIRVPGRLERVGGGGGAAFFVDFAHTDDALKNVLSTLRPLTPGRLIAVFGAGGDRDRSKRPRMGRVAGEYADQIILTSDNPRGEDPQAILAEIAAGIPAGSAYVVEPDRAAAIALAVKTARPGDSVVIAGKGHEVTQEIAGVCYPFDDREILKELVS